MVLRRRVLAAVMLGAAAALASSAVMPCHVPGDACGEPGGGACAPFVCATPTPVRTTVACSFVGDGRCDCCDCSDEARDGGAGVGPRGAERGQGQGQRLPRACEREIDGWVVARREAAAEAEAGVAAAAAAVAGRPRVEARGLLVRAREDAKRAARGAADAAASVRKAERELREAAAGGLSKRKAQAAWTRLQDLGARARASAARSEHAAAVAAAGAFGPGDALADLLAGPCVSSAAVGCVRAPAGGGVYTRRERALVCVCGGGAWMCVCARVSRARAAAGVPPERARARDWMRVCSDKAMRGGYTTVIPKSYVFRVCPYRNVTQAQLRPREWQRLEDAEDRRQARGVAVDAAGGAEGAGAGVGAEGEPVLIGVFSGWVAAGNASARLPAPPGGATAIMRYEFGAPCAGGPGGGGRVALVVLACGPAPALRGVIENGMCEYSMTLVTPFVCDARDAAAARAAAAAWEPEEPI